LLSSRSPIFIILILQNIYILLLHRLNRYITALISTSASNLLYGIIFLNYKIENDNLYKIEYFCYFLKHSFWMKHHWIKFNRQFQNRLSKLLKCFLKNIATITFYKNIEFLVYKISIQFYKIC